VLPDSPYPPPREGGNYLELCGFSLLVDSCQAPRWNVLSSSSVTPIAR